MAAEDRWEVLAESFHRFAEDQARGRSRLYQHLASAIIGTDVASLLLEAPIEQRRPNLLLAAVHDLLLRGIEHPLARYYPSVGGWREPDEQLLATFRDFCTWHEDVLRGLVSTRNTQTNEVRRCAALLPALRRAARQASAPLTIVEVGASAGLNLLMDRFAYRYDDLLVGPDDAALVIDCALRNGTPPPLNTALSSARRVGIDLHPLDVHDADHARWLRACVWPEHLDRLHLLAAAIAVAQREPPELVAGHALEALPEVVATLPAGTELCVFNSATLAYFSQAERGAFVDLIESLSTDRPVWWVSLEAAFIEPFDWRASTTFQEAVEGLTYLITLTRMAGGCRVDDHLLGRSDPHGRWIEWIAD
ncbi:MAG: DUF2332 domain-containing protein [Actinomycetota bacterium]|nr:DUF2332 domain-containing protein [Actinomycetota bacterium]